MARFHGLHKDPSTLTVLTIDNSDIHLWRKTWATLLHLDSTQAFEFGMSLLVQDNGNGTKEPFKDLLSNEFWTSNETIATSSTATRMLNRAKFSIRRTTIPEADGVCIEIFPKLPVYNFAAPIDAFFNHWL